MCVNGGLDEWYELQYKGKKAGMVHIKCQWFPTMTQQQQVQFGANALAGFMGGVQHPGLNAMQMQAPMGYAMGAPAQPQQQMGYPPQQQMGYPPQQQMGYPPQQQQMGYPPQQ